MLRLHDPLVMLEGVDELRPEDDWPRLGKLIRERREALGWTRDQLAHESGVSSRTIADYEHGVIPQGRYPYKVKRVCNALGWADGADTDILAGGDPVIRLTIVTDASDQDSDLVFILRNVHDAGARSLKAMRAVLESDLERD